MNKNRIGFFVVFLVLSFLAVGITTAGKPKDIGVKVSFVEKGAKLGFFGNTDSVFLWVWQETEGGYIQPGKPFTLTFPGDSLLLPTNTVEVDLLSARGDPQWGYLFLKRDHLDDLVGLEAVFYRQELTTTVFVTNGTTTLLQVSDPFDDWEVVIQPEESFKQAFATGSGHIDIGHVGHEGFKGWVMLDWCWENMPVITSIEQVEGPWYDLKGKHLVPEWKTEDTHLVIAGISGWKIIATPKSVDLWENDHVRFMVDFLGLDFMPLWVEIRVGGITSATYDFPRNNILFLPIVLKL